MTSTQTAAVILKPNAKVLYLSVALSVTLILTGAAVVLLTSTCLYKRHKRRSRIYHIHEHSDNGRESNEVIRADTGTTTASTNLFYI